MKKIPAVFCWSGGKDSSYALYKVLQQGEYEVKYLLSTINGNYRRLSMHGVREALIELQAEHIGLPLIKVYVYEANNEEYEKQMNEALLQLKSEGINTVLFGDIFLEDLREYREQKMAAVGMQCVFPIWKISTAELVKDFVAKGFKSYTCCINDGYLDESWAGRLIDDNFINQLPTTVDPCGENGEYHSFCFNGPIYQKPIRVSVGEKRYEPLLLKPGQEHPTPIKENTTKGFWFADILLNQKD